jgi:biopolymer transport protein ExbB
VFEVLTTLSKGGLVMVPLAVCSLLAATVIVERYLALRNADRGGAEVLSAIRRALHAGDGAEALAQCEETASPLAEVLAAGLRAHLVGLPVSEAMEERMLASQSLLHRRLVVLDTIVTLAPLLGLLGTVLGMISAFQIISIKGTSHPAGITGGVAEALIATASGLAIAIFSLIGYNWCRDKLRRITEEIELRATQLEHLLRTAGEAGSSSVHPAMQREGVPLAH